MILLFIGLVSLEIFVAFFSGFLPYRRMEIESTMIRGVQAVDAPNGLMMGMVCRMAMTKKKILATLKNCKRRDSK